MQKTCTSQHTNCLRNNEKPLANKLSGMVSRTDKDVENVEPGDPAVIMSENIAWQKELSYKYPMPRRFLMSLVSTYTALLCVSIRMPAI